MCMYIARVPNRSSPPAILLRESRRQGQKVTSRTLANLTHWPPEKIDALRRVLANEPLIPLGAGGAGPFEIQRSLPHGHVAAVLGTLRRLGLERMLASKKSGPRDLVVAMIVARVIDPRSKLATARGLGSETAFTSLGEALGVSAATEDDLYAAMDWLLPRQASIEKALARRQSERAYAGVVRRDFDLFRGTALSAGAFRPPSRSAEGGERQVADRLRIAVPRRRIPRRGGGVQGNTADPKTLSKQIESSASASARHSESPVATWEKRWA